MGLTDTDTYSDYSVFIAVMCYQSDIVVGGTLCEWILHHSQSSQISLFYLQSDKKK